MHLHRFNSYFNLKIYYLSNFVPSNLKTQQDTHFFLYSKKLREEDFSFKKDKSRKNFGKSSLPNLSPDLLNQVNITLIYQKKLIC